MIVKATLLLVSAVIVSAENFTPNNFIQLARPSVPAVSPDGAWAVYAQSAYNSTAAKVCL